MSATAASLRAVSGLLRLDWLAPAAITLAAALVYINGAFFSSVSALHVDLSINFTAAHAMREGENPYGEEALLERARELKSPPDLGGPEPFIYQTLFTSYIQPPVSALLLLPVTVLDWREATRLYLLANNALLLGAAALTLVTVRPTVPMRWAIAGAAVIVAFYSQVYGSFALGQVDASIAFLLALGLWGYSRGRPAVAGGAIALGTAIKLIPVLLLAYFVWKRDYRVAAWGLAIGAGLFLVSLPLAGVDTYWTYLTETVPALMKGSTHYANISIGGVYNRLFVGDDFGGALGPLLTLEEVPSRGGARLLSAVTMLALLGLTAAVAGRRRPPLEQTAPGAQSYVLEYYLVVAVSLLASSVTWEFYVVWLLPLFLAALLAPERVLPGPRGLRAGAAAVLVACYIALNYPGDHYLFDVNSVFYHPEWVPGIVVEDVVDLYPLPPWVGGHLSLVPPIRLAALSLLAAVLAALVVLSRRQAGPAFDGDGGTPLEARKVAELP